MRFIDSNIIAYSFYDNEHKASAREILNQSGVINTVNLIEAYNIIEAEANQDFAIRTIRSLLKSNLLIVDVDINLVFEALKKAPKYPNLKFIDLIHYVTALLQNCDEIASYDDDFDDLEIKRVT